MKRWIGLELEGAREKTRLVRTVTTDVHLHRIRYRGWREWDKELNLDELGGQNCMSRYFLLFRCFWISSQSFHLPFSERLFCFTVRMSDATAMLNFDKEETFHWCAIINQSCGKDLKPTELEIVREFNRLVGSCRAVLRPYFTCICTFPLQVIEA